MTTLERLADMALEGLPRVVGVVLLLLAGLLLVRLIAWLFGRALRSAGVDRHAERLRVHDVLERIGFGRSLAGAIEVALRLTLTLVVVFAALGLLGLAALEPAFNAAVLFLPRLIAAMAIVVVGLVLGGVTREWVDRVARQMALPATLGPIAEVSVVAVFVVTALAQVGVPTAVLAAVAGVVAGAAALTFALAFGLGSRDVAREASAGRYVTTVFEVGQRISVGEVSGQILSIEAASTIVETDEGGRVRVPNHLLLDSVVAIGEERPEGGGTTGARRVS